ncbi:HNH endonuclease [Bacillus inaquosorum]|uniref:HNH endonuclease n=1 Tax=Bacillus inaquosorum TaxID=483913 RepID=UPI00227E2562|nr:HNH endonuclease [Bacillus inaquosorum]MCY8147026.1 HNH endonuclease [Bacillus inaquosorum]
MTMKSHPIRLKTPKRTCIKSYKVYRSYKPYLAQDFNRSCGYCGDFDGWSGGIKVYHIDHFVPKSLFPHLQNKYYNLVYACPYCNASKSNDWPTGKEKIFCTETEGYIDPCDTEYEQHLYRNSVGAILPKSTVGAYMHRTLKLFLRRHEVIWNVTQLKYVLDEIKLILVKENLNIPPKKIEQLKCLYAELNLEFHEYLDYIIS